MAGSYTVQYALTQRDTGANTFHRVLFAVAQGATAAVPATATPAAAVNGPSYVGAIGRLITLRDGASYDPKQRGFALQLGIEHPNCGQHRKP